jgi:hypothetical protein
MLIIAAMTLAKWVCNENLKKETKMGSVKAEV